MTPHGVIHRIMQEVGIAKCAERVGKSEDLIRKWGDPDHASLPNIAMALELDRLHIECGCSRPGQSPFVLLFAQSVSSGANVGDTNRSILVEAMDIPVAVGSLLQEIKVAVSDQVITQNEKAKLTEHIQALKKEILELEHVVEQQ